MSERVEVSDECWVEVPSDRGAPPWIVTVRFPRFACGGWWDGEHLTRSALDFAGREWIPRIEAALSAWSAPR